MGRQLVEFYSSVGLAVEPELLTYSSLDPFEIGQHFSAFSAAALGGGRRGACTAQSFRDHAEDLLWPPLLLPMLSERDLRP